MKPIGYYVSLCKYDPNLTENFDSLYDAIKYITEKYQYPFCFVNSNEFILYAFYQNGKTIDISLKEFIEEFELSEEEIKKIEITIDSRIERDEKRISLPGFFNVSGYVPFRRKDRQKYINQTIKSCSWRWKDLNSFNWEELENKYIQEWVII